MRTSQPKRPSRKVLDQIVAEFNRSFPIGTAVLLRRAFGQDHLRTEVTAAAVVMCGHSAVAWFRGVSGCFSIEQDRVCRDPDIV